METLFFIYIAVLFITFHYQILSNPGVWITHNDRVLPNNSIVNLEDINFQGKGTLKCWTSWYYCCNAAFTLDNEFIGHWYLPSGESVGFKSDYIYSGIDIYRSRIHQVVLLHRKEGGTEGIFHCSIPNENGENIDLYVGIYKSSTPAGNDHNFFIHTYTLSSTHTNVCAFLLNLYSLL